MLLSALIVFVVLGLTGELLAAALTGRDQRTYTTWPADTTIMSGEREVVLVNYAARYAPVIRTNPAHLPPNVEHIWYQAVVRGDTVVLVYYLLWENELHPNPIVHRLYETYRWAVYGSVRDIEYIELHIDRNTGVVQRMRFETATDGDYNRQWTTHLYAYLDLNAAGNGYDYCILDHEGSCQSDYTLIDGVWDAGNRPVVGVMTWNHLYTLLPDDDYGAYTHVIDAPLRYLTDDDFRDEKLARRSQGDLKVQTDNSLRNVLRVIFWSLSALFTLRGLRL